MEVQIATRIGVKVTGLEVRKVGRQTRFALTRHADAKADSGYTDWAITHVKTGRSIMGLVTSIMPPTVANLSAVIKAWDKLDPQPDWSVIDGLEHGQNANLKGRANKAAALVFAQRLRQAASEVYEARYIRPGRL